MTRDEEIATEESFISGFEKKLDATESGASDDADDKGGNDSSSADEDTDHDTDDASSSDNQDEDDESEDADEDASDDDEEDGAVDESSDDDDEEEGGKDEDGEDEDDGDENDGESDADKGKGEKATADADAQTAEFQKALKNAGLKLTLNDVPAEARPIVRRKLAEMQTAFTRAQQDATSWRPERTKLLAEQRFRDEHPELAIAEILKKHPELAEKVNAQVDKLSDEDKARLFDSDVKEARKKAFDALAAEETAVEKFNQRADAIETYVRRAATNLGIPAEAMEDIEEAIALRITNKPDDQRDISEEEIDDILMRKLRLYKGVTRRTAREKKRENIRIRARDRRVSTPAVRTGSGVTAPSPGGKRKPKNDEEFAAMMEAKL